MAAVGKVGQCCSSGSRAQIREAASPGPTGKESGPGRPLRGGCWTACPRLWWAQTRPVEWAPCWGACLENHPAFAGTVPGPSPPPFGLFRADLPLLLRLFSAGRQRWPRCFISAAPLFARCSFAFLSGFLSLPQPFQPSFQGFQAGSSRRESPRWHTSSPGWSGGLGPGGSACQANLVCLYLLLQPSGTAQ